MKAQTMTKIIVSAVLAAALAVTASAAFAKKNSYAGQFADVKETSWYAKEVSSAYELGFVEGVSDTQYSPDTTVTVAQGITMASRVHAEFNGNTIESKTDGGKWYQMYVDYATENGIITEKQFDDYTREIKRFEMAELFHDAMGKAYYNSINSIKNIPDVNVGAMYRDKILTLYNAGILTGNDKYGVFTPNASIKRSECAAIINRVALPENRKTVNLEPLTSGEAYVLCYDEGVEQFGNRFEGISSGWILDNRGGVAKTDLVTTSTVGDVSEKYGSAFIREFNYFDTGRLVLEIDFRTRDDGAYVEYRDIDGNTVYMIKIVNGKWSILKTDGSYAPIGDVSVDGETFLRATIDLGTGKSTTVLNDKDCGTYDLLSDNILSFAIGIDEKGTGALTVGTVNMVVNYAVNDSLDFFGPTELYGWTDAVNTMHNAGQIDMLADSAITKNFDSVDGNVIFETYFNMKNGSDFNIKLGNSLNLKGESQQLKVGDTVIYKALVKNLWYRLRVEANTEAGTAEVHLNGRRIADVKLDSKNGINFVTYESKGFFAVDNVKVYNYNKPDDYVPTPTAKASLDDYVVGINICSLWRNGNSHYGWACISPYDERKPVIGYYDEGVPETADWEIKYMVEHGIDFQAFCWFQDVSTGPIKTPLNSEQLHNGYMYADYSDYMNYILLWEASNSPKFDSTQFRTHVVPYWFENYFLDDRYLKIDNKLVLSIFGYDKLQSSEYFLNSSGVKKEFDYLESKAKEYGYDGFIFLYCGSDVANDRYAKSGYDGAHAYGWGITGNKLSTNVAKNTSGAKATSVYQIPTLNIGFDSIPWNKVRYDVLPVEEFEKGLVWIKDEYIPTNANKDDWTDRFMWLSTWNEYGEGTYLMPAGDRGFGYVDQVRKHMTNLPDSHTDLVPTAHQAERINHLYPQYATLARREGWYDFNKTTDIKRTELKNKLYINDVDMQKNAEVSEILPPIEREGRLLFAYNGAAAMDHVLGAYSEWRRDVETLKISANGHELMFKAGSDMYMKDGVLSKLGYTVENFDGLLMLDFTKLAEDLGYTAVTKKGDLYVYTDTYDTIWGTEYTPKTGDWQFDHSFNDEGWVSSNMNIITNKGTMTFITIDGNNDPIMRYSEKNFPDDFLTERFSEVEIRIRYNYRPSSANPNATKMYFLTDIDGEWNEAKALVFKHEVADTQGEWLTLKVDLTQDPDWQAAEFIKALRFDPFDGQGMLEIDYIKFKNTPGYTYIPVEERPAEVKNGNAEDASINTHTSHNATITRVSDPDKSGNNVWYVESIDANGAFVYFNSPCRYKSYMKYKIEYDIKLAGNDAGTSEPSASRFQTNLKYTDASGIDHVVRNGRENISTADGWVHYEGLWTTENILTHKDSMFSVYLNPVDGHGFNYYLDNIKITELGTAKTQFTEFDWDTLVGKSCFGKDNTAESFKVEQATSKVEDGKLVIIADEGAKDVKFKLNDTEFNATEYDGLAIRMKVTGTDVETDYVDVYFASKESPDLAESKKINVKYQNAEIDSEGYMTILCDFASKKPSDWIGTINQIRIDPTAQTGTVTISDIVLVKAGVVEG